MQAKEVVAASAPGVELHPRKTRIVHPVWNDQLTYPFGLSDGSIIDDAEGGNATRHINHACVPNVEVVERRSAGD